jgi:GTP-binding protein
MLNPFAHAQFQLSCAQLSQLPVDPHAEVAFAGRSNAGKSSALNVLCGRRQLARVSKTPGRTQLINLFSLPSGQRLVDLPGYGYAAVPEAMRRNWGKLIGGYFQQRSNLSGVVIIMDIRHPLTPEDQQMVEWTRAAGKPCVILLTKSDKLGFGAAKNQLLAVEAHVRKIEMRAQVLLFSSLNGRGVEDTRLLLEDFLGIEPDVRPVPDAVA